MTPLPTISDLEVAGRTVLVRADLNVPLADRAVADEFRIGAAIPTIAALREGGARVVVASHLGRPDGRDPALSLAPVAARLGELGGFDVVMAGDTAGAAARQAVADAPDGSVVVLENTRFEPGETSNDPALADAFASLADAFVLDAFGSAHRAHASTVGVAERLPSAAGMLMADEVAAFERLLSDPDRPYIVLLGGSKVSDKLGVIEALLPKVDVMLVGGAMCFTLLAAEGYEVGGSLVEDDMVGAVRRVLDGPYGGRLSLPIDVVVAERFAADAATTVAPTSRMPADGMGLDIGPATAERFSEIVAGSDTLFWNGPMGVFEWEAFASGTRGVAESVAASEGYTVVGGGDTVSALRSFGLADRVSHLSTGGGAGLELLEEGSLPGIDVLRREATS
jgi:phosphoglycerate kinase